MASVAMIMAIDGNNNWQNGNTNSHAWQETMASNGNDNGHKWPIIMAIMAILMAINGNTKGIINGHNWQY